MSPRTGRPTDNPKPYKITVRIDEKVRKFLMNTVSKNLFRKWKQYVEVLKSWKAI